jgi:hypothetical protein
VLNGKTEVMSVAAKKKNTAAQILGRKGGKARAQKQTPKQRSESARNAAMKRWEKERESK